MLVNGRQGAETRSPLVAAAGLPQAYGDAEALRHRRWPWAKGISVDFAPHPNEMQPASRRPAVDKPVRVLRAVRGVIGLAICLQWDLQRPASVWPGGLAVAASETVFNSALESSDGAEA